jgi:hypothetical protein
MGEKGKVLPTPFSPKWGEPHASEEQVLILFMDLCVKTLAGLGRNYRWQRPECCPRCAGVRVWGHGFVVAYFDVAGAQCVFLKRYRCPECRVVIRVRPLGYWKRIQASVEAVRQCVIDRIGTGRWPPGSNPARQRHWLRALKRQVVAQLGMSFAQRLEEGLEELLRRGICAVSRSV